MEDELCVMHLALSGCNSEQFPVHNLIQLVMMATKHDSPGISIEPLPSSLRPFQFNRSEIIYEEGCGDAALKWVKDNYVLVGGIAFGLLFLEVSR